jgi:hypothetical protein
LRVMRTSPSALIRVPRQRGIIGIASAAAQK